MKLSPLQTPRLRLVLNPPEYLRALIESDAAYERAIGWPPAPGLRQFAHTDAISPAWLAKIEAVSESDPWTHGFSVVLAASGQVMGMAGFKGPPDAEGTVEIAYGIIAEYENKGYATEAAAALIAFARTHNTVKTICAHTLPEANASSRVLAKNGLILARELIDPEDGRVWRWEMNVER